MTIKPVSYFKVMNSNPNRQAYITWILCWFFEMKSYSAPWCSSLGAKAATGNLSERRSSFKRLQRHIRIGYYHAIIEKVKIL